MSNNKILVSGIKPTGRLHLGNYLGAIRQFLDLSESYESYIFIADLHALTTVQNKEELRENIINIAIDYIALGLDPKKVTIFNQSAVPAHAELAWIFNCLTTVPYLMRAHAYKDSVAKNKEINVGVFDYPMLMAADILLYDADVVPVGNDQKQHVEIARDTAAKFNRTFSEVFKAPKELIIDGVGIVPGTDGQKMSKSYGNTIGLFADLDEIKDSVMRIPTDSKGVDEVKNPEECKIFALHKLFTEKTVLENLRDRYTTGRIGYKESKELLIESLNAFIEPLRKKRDLVAGDVEGVLDILQEGNRKAKNRADAKMQEVKEAVGLSQLV